MPARSWSPRPKENWRVTFTASSIHRGICGLGLVEASQNKIGSPVDQLLLYCYHYDPAQENTAPSVMNMMRVGGVVTLFGMVAIVFRYAPAQRRRRCDCVREATA